jgi:hypothetical protein
MNSKPSMNFKFFYNKLFFNIKTQIDIMLQNFGTWLSFCNIKTKFF